MTNLLGESFKVSLYILPTNSNEKAREFQKNFCFMDYAKEMEISNNFTCFLRNLVFGSRSKLEPYMEQWTGSKLGKQYDQAVHCHAAYLTYMQSAS